MKQHYAMDLSNVGRDFTSKKKQNEINMQDSSGHLRKPSEYDLQAAEATQATPRSVPWPRGERLPSGLRPPLGDVF